MKILIAPDKFKGSLNAKDLCNAIAEGILVNYPDAEIVKFPLADGGEGSVDIIEQHLNLNTISLEVCDPLFRKITASYKINETTAYIEMAAASGFDLLTEEERNPMLTTTYGTGEMIQDALDRGVKKVYLFIGGSATCDAGMGMAQAMDYQFLDKNGENLSGIGKNMAKIATIITPKNSKYRNLKCVTLCDVKNPLAGENGAAYVFGPQKGASPDQVKLLDTGLKNFAAKVKEYLNKEISEIPGSGAAGGLGGGSIAFLNAKLKSGIDSIFEIVQFEKQLKNVDLIITGEGKLDKQTLEGKVVSGVSAFAKKNNIPLYVICGDVDLNESDLKKLGVEKLSSVMQIAKNKQDAFDNTATLVKKIAENMLQKGDF
ncbi:glycerate kinase [Leeuwenhoekiella sp. A16]|uniref:glycerate kinase family protein n=1 Tax=unclassified Leeuwenhoekiella TaxID=2615029 RepID=UPI003A7FCFCA